MTTLNLMQIKNEILHFLRYSDVFTTSVRGVTRTTEGYTVGAGGEATHTFSHNPIRDFKYITVNGVNKYYLRDYDVDFSTGILTWNSALVNTDIVATQYDYGNSDKLFPDLPRDDLTLTSFPRLGIEIVSISTEPLGIGGTTHINDILLSIILWVPVNKDVNIAGGYGGITDLESTMNLIRDAMRTNAKSFFTFSWIYPKSRGPLIKGTNNKIMQSSADFLIKFKFE